MKECPKCGTMMADHETQCVGCGSAIQDPPASPAPPSHSASQTTCPYCGGLLPSAMARLCPSCRRPLMGSSPQVPSASPGVSRTPARQSAAASATGNDPKKVLIIGGAAIVFVILCYLGFGFATGAFTNNGMKALQKMDSGSSSHSFNMDDSSDSSSDSGSGSSWVHMGSDESAAPADGKAPSSLTRRSPITEESDEHYTLVEDHAERRGSSWVIIGKVHNKENRACTVTIQYDFSDANGSSAGTGDGTVKLAPNADGTYEVSVPNNSSITTYNDASHMWFGGE